jgi:hypothetical protein
VDAARGRHARRQENHMPVAAMCVTIVADLVGIGARVRWGRPAATCAEGKTAGEILGRKVG